LSDIEEDIETVGEGVKGGGVEGGMAVDFIVYIVVEAGDSLVSFGIGVSVVRAVGVGVVVVGGEVAKVKATVLWGQVGGGRSDYGGGGGAVNVNVDISGGAGGHAEEASKVCAVFGRKTLGMGEKELLGFLIIGEPLEKGATETVDLVLGDGPGCINAWEPALCNSVKFRWAASGGFIGAAFGLLDRGGLVKVEEAGEVGGGCRSGDRGRLGC
jgi:hypothetical protein